MRDPNRPLDEVEYLASPGDAPGEQAEEPEAEPIVFFGSTRRQLVNAGILVVSCLIVFLAVGHHDILGFKDRAERQRRAEAVERERRAEREAKFQAKQSPWRRTQADKMAAPSRRDLEMALAMFAARDSRALADLTVSGRLILTKPGVRVQIMQRDDGLACIRPEGHTGCLWIEERDLLLEPYR